MRKLVSYLLSILVILGLVFEQEASREIIESDMDFAMNVPIPRLISTTPMEESILMASRTEFLATPSFCASSDSAGNLSPGFRRPESRSSVITFTMVEESDFRPRGCIDS